MRARSDTMYKYAMQPNDDKDTPHPHDRPTSQPAHRRNTRARDGITPKPDSDQPLQYTEAIHCRVSWTYPTRTHKLLKQHRHPSPLNPLNPSQKLPDPPNLHILTPLALHRRNQTPQQLLDHTVLNTRTQRHDAAVLLLELGTPALQPFRLLPEEVVVLPVRCQSRT